MNLSALPGPWHGAGRFCVLGSAGGSALKHSAATVRRNTVLPLPQMATRAVELMVMGMENLKTITSQRILWYLIMGLSTIKVG